MAPPTPPLNAIPNSQIRPPKLNLLPFDGSAPLDWLFQADQYFMFYQVPWDQRVPIAAFYMQGDALSWFKWMFHNNQLGDWTSFARALEIRFDPSSYKNHQGELLKLQIQNEIALFQPQTISQAIGLAKLIEAKLKDTKPKFTRSSSSFQYQTSTPTKSANPVPKPTTTKEPQSIPVKRLSYQQLQERRAAGLCYNCDEKFHPGHNCATPKFLLLLSHDDFELEFTATDAVFGRLRAQPSCSLSTLISSPHWYSFTPNPAI
uniref:Retrotransposon gag domain-containing protein n=1 Tax=Cajanus cajan TaxID=3821 RepID=A0A151S966_CAJCA|nr:hypothetical protein KK1_026863 [Cajanus cajan]